MGARRLRLVRCGAVLVLVRSRIEAAASVLVGVLADDLCSNDADGVT